MEVAFDKADKQSRHRKRGVADIIAIVTSHLLTKMQIYTAHVDLDLLANEKAVYCK